jgi:hypothetical protein
MESLHLSFHRMQCQSFPQKKWGGLGWVESPLVLYCVISTSCPVLDCDKSQKGQGRVAYVSQQSFGSQFGAAVTNGAQIVAWPGRCQRSIGL